MKSVRLFSLIVVPYLQMRSVGSHSTSEREKEEKDGVNLIHYESEKL